MNEATVTVKGNLGADAEIKTLSNGNTVTSFSLGNTPRIKKNDEWIDGETIWFRVSVWGKDATGASGFKKGERVVVHGKLSQNSYTDKENNERKSLEINAEMCGLVFKNDPVNNNDSDSSPWA